MDAIISIAIEIIIENVNIATLVFSEYRAAERNCVLRTLHI